MESVEFKEALEIKRHKELLLALKAIHDKLSAIPQESAINKDLKRILQSLEMSVKGPKNEDLVEEIRKLSEVWSNSIVELKPDIAKEWIFDIRRNSQGFIESVKATKK